MKIRVMVTAAVLVAGLSAPSFAFEGVRGMRTHSLVTSVSCDVRMADEDKQAKCAQKCDDEFISGQQHYGSDINKVRAEKKECDAKCGCSGNTKE